MALAVGDERPARRGEIQATVGAYAGERPFGHAANLPSTRPREPTDADMGLGRRRGAPKESGKDEGAKPGVNFLPLSGGEGFPW
jgi:excinuclease ABC subunit B